MHIFTTNVENVFIIEKYFKVLIYGYAYKFNSWIQNAEKAKKS